MIGQIISHYKVIEGGMGEVHRAEDTSPKREVASSFCLSSESEMSSYRLFFEVLYHSD
jgi:hypothetical protein